MSELRSDNPVALQFLITEEIYLIDKPENVAADIRSEEEEDPSEFTGFDYIGENNKYMVLLVSSSSHLHMAPPELDALQRTLVAKGMDLKDVALLNVHRYPNASFNQVKAFFACNKIVLFGIDPAKLQIPAQAMNVPGVHEGVSVLLTSSFTEMMTDLEKKKQFWNVMRTF